MSSEFPQPGPFETGDRPGASFPNDTSSIESSEPINQDQGPGEPVGEAMTYLHPTSLIFDLLAHGKTYLVPAAFGLWGAANGDMTLLIISALIFIPAFMFSVFRYFTFRYCIVDDQLIVRQGLIFRNMRTVPVSRIQNIDYVQNPLHRLLRVAEVKVETASGTKPEAVLRVLSLAKMESLRSGVFGESGTEKPQASVSSTLDQHAQDPIRETELAPVAREKTLAEPTTILEVPLGWLIKAGLASNRGMIMVGVVLGAYFQFTDRRTFFDYETVKGMMPQQLSTLFIVGASVAGVLLALLLLRLLGVGWFVLRFYGYRLVRRGDDLRISCGLFTKVSATVPRQRVQFISIHRNLFMRMMGLASIRIETAGGAGKEGENATESVSKRWFIPVVPEEQVPSLLSLLRPGLQWNEASMDFKPLAPKAGRRLCRKAIVQAILIAGIGMLATRPWGWTFGLVILPLLFMWAIKKSKAMRYARMDNGVVYRSGVFIHKTSATFFEKIQTLRFDQSPFDRRWKMATLSVDTAAAGPADHRIQIPYLDEQFAREELALLRLKTGKEQPVYG